MSRAWRRTIPGPGGELVLDFFGHFLAPIFGTILDHFRTLFGVHFRSHPGSLFHTPSRPPRELADSLPRDLTLNSAGSWGRAKPRRRAPNPTLAPTFAAATPKPRNAPEHTPTGPGSAGSIFSHFSRIKNQSTPGQPCRKAYTFFSFFMFFF